MEAEKILRDCFSKIWPQELQSKTGRKIINPEILFVILPPWGVDTPPLAPASLSSYLRKKDFKTDIFDANIYCYNRIDEKYRYFWEMGNASYWRQNEAFDRVLLPALKEILDDCVERIISSGIEIVGFSVLSTSQNLVTSEVIRKIKERKPEIKIILGGISVSVKEQRVFFENRIPGLVDIYVIGEGERATEEILKAIRRGRKIEQIPGAFIHNEVHCAYVRCNQEKDLTRFYYPSFEEFDLDSYINKHNGLIMEWTRGCAGNCSFCAFKVISGKLRKKSVDLIVEALSYYKKKFSVGHLSLVDSAVNSDLKYLEDICEALIASGINLKFSALAIPRKGMDAGIIGKMKQAGFMRIEYGIESASNKVLKAMNKIFTAEEAEAVIRLTHESGITTVIYLIAGFPGENERDFNETLNFLRRNAGYIDFVKSVNPLFLMAGSRIYKNLSKYGISLPQDNPDFMWQIGESNSYQMRLERVHKIREVLQENGIKFFSGDNQFEKKIEIGN